MEFTELLIYIVGFAIGLPIIFLIDILIVNKDKYNNDNKIERFK